VSEREKNKEDNKKNLQMQAGSRGWDADVDEAMGAVALGKKGEVEREMLNLGQVTSACAVVSTSILFFTNCHATMTLRLGRLSPAPPLSVHLLASSVCAAAFVSFFLFVSISSFTHSHFPSATSTPLSSSTPSTLTHVDDFVSSSFFYIVHD
jgi:hypothetical protein